MKRDISIVNPELQWVANMLPSFSFSRRNLWLLRWINKLSFGGKVPQDVSIETIFIPREDQSKIRLRVYRSKTKNGSVPVMVWLHGGGYIGGSLKQEDPACVQYVRETGIVIVSVDYRFAPEHPFPAALNDCYTALKWVHANAAQLDIDPERIAISGESAGGGLAAALVQLACDRKEVRPIFQLLVYPMLDDRTCTRTDLVDHGFLMWSQASNRFGWESYLGKDCCAADTPPHSVPARRVDLSGLPPAWVGVGTLDLFHDEDVAYAQRLKESGVPCELNIVQGAFHGFDMAGTQLKVVQEFRESQIAALKNHLLRN